MAKIILKKDGKVIHRETETFDRRPAAAAWIARREDELAKPGAIERAKASPNDPALHVAIDRYIDESEKAFGRSKKTALNVIKASEIAFKNCSAIDSPAIVDFARSLNIKPQSRARYLSHLAGVFAVAKPMWKYPLDYSAIEDAQTVLARLGIIGKSKSRDRRPTLDELDRLMTYFQARQKRDPRSLPMCRLIAFAIFSTRRQDEICHIAWADLDEEHSRVLVRDMKNPGEKKGNDVWVDLPEPALRIIKATPKTDGRIFPYTASWISALFTAACAELKITTDEMPADERLHFHDLRHDGISRLFETGMNIPHAASVSGHRSWTNLKRYTHIRQSGDKYAGWKWLDPSGPILDNGGLLANDQDGGDDRDHDGEADHGIGDR